MSEPAIPSPDEEMACGINDLHTCGRQDHPNRTSWIYLFYDPYERASFSASCRICVKIRLFGKLYVNLFERGTLGIIERIHCRTRYIDDVLDDAIHDGIGNTVILGAGWIRRRKGSPGRRWCIFYVDLPEEQTVNKRPLIWIFTSLPRHVVFTPLDLNSRSFEKQLAMHGLGTNRTTPFILESVTQYPGDGGIDPDVHRADCPGQQTGIHVPPRERRRREFHTTRCW